MRNREVWLGIVLTAGLVFVGYGIYTRYGSDGPDTIQIVEGESDSSAGRDARAVTEALGGETDVASAARPSALTGASAESNESATTTFLIDEEPLLVSAESVGPLAPADEFGGPPYAGEMAEGPGESPAATGPDVGPAPAKLRDLRLSGENRVAAPSDLSAGSGSGTIVREPPPGTNPASTSRRARRPGRENRGSVAVDRHVVKSGESFAWIARMYYGSERYTQFLMQANPQVPSPQALRPGMVLAIPDPSADDRSRAGGASAASAKSRGSGSSTVSGSSGPTYKVRAGDSFYAIARRELGDVSRWKELFEMNADLVDGEPRNLKIGQVIRLPQ